MSKRYKTLKEEMRALVRSSADTAMNYARKPDEVKFALAIAIACDVIYRDVVDANGHKRRVLAVWDPISHIYVDLISRLLYLTTTLSDDPQSMLESKKEPQKLMHNIVSKLSSNAQMYDELMTKARFPEDDGLLIVQLKDGLFDLKQDKYVDNAIADQYHMRSKLDFVRNTRIDSVNQQILDRLFKKDWSNGDEGRAQFLLDILRASIEGDNKSRGVLLYGSGGNGKSTFLNMLRSLLPAQSVVMMNLHEFNEKFALEMLSLNTTVILGDELESNFSFAGKAMSNLKQLIVGQPVTVNPKGKAIHTIQIKPFVIQAMNTQIVFREATAANKDRWIFYIWPDINFREKKRRGDVEFDLEQMMRDKSFIESLFNYVLNNTEYSSELNVPNSVENDTANLIDNADNIKSFVEEMIDEKVVGHDEYLPSSVLYDMYVQYLRDTSVGAHPMKRATFTKRIADELKHLGYELALNHSEASKQSVHKVNLSQLNHLQWNRTLASDLSGVEYDNTRLRTSCFVNRDLHISNDEVEQVRASIHGNTELELTSRIERILRYLVQDVNDVIAASIYRDM